MSLTSILKKIDKVSQKHREIQRRCNSSSKHCPRQSQLFKQTQEDQRIFGYSGSHILGLFKKNRQSNEQTRPCTAVLENTNQRYFQQLGNKTPTATRTQSAFRPVVKYREQYTFAFKEDIFDENCQKIRATMPYDWSKIKNNQKVLSLKFKKHVPFSTNCVQKRTLKHEKIQFIDSFEENLDLLRQQKEKPNSKVIRNRMTYNKKTDKKSNPQMKSNQNEEDVFKLTRASFDLHNKKLKNIRETTKLLTEKQFQQFQKLGSDNMEPQPLEGLYQFILRLLPKRFVMTCITVPSLLSLKLSLQIVEDELVIQQTKQKTDLKVLANVFLQQHPFIHLCFHSGGELIYDLFLSGQSIQFSKKTQIQINLVSYYLKRFLLFDTLAPQVNSVQAINQSAQLFIKANIDIPDSYIDYTDTFDKKIVHFYDKDHRYFTLGLKPVLKSGLLAVQAFKKEMGYGQKVVKLKHGTRQQIKKELCNWAYFYICLLTISQKYQYLWQQFIFSRLFYCILSIRFLFSATSCFLNSRINFHGTFFSFLPLPAYTTTYSWKGYLMFNLSSYSILCLSLYFSINSLLFSLSFLLSLMSSRLTSSV